MSYARETSLANRSFTPALQTPWAGPLGIGWTTAFLTSAAQILSPVSVRKFFHDLARKDRMLFRFGWALVFAVPVFAALGLITHAATLNASPWIKPIKFAISFASFAWTVSVFLIAVRIPAWQRRLARRTIVASVTVEMLCLAAQAWRNAGAHPTAFADFVIQQGTTVMVCVNTLITIWLLVVFSSNRVRIKLNDYAQITAIRLSIWSTIAGDLRIAHFIALHAIQIVPLFAFILADMTPKPSLRQRNSAVYAVAALVALVVGATFVQAALGHPLLAIGR
jgi:hypothetical protein